MSLPKSQVGILVSLSLSRPSPIISLLLSGLIVPCSEDRVRVTASLESSGSAALPEKTPHYYKPYFGYLSSCIMSYALNVVLDNDHSYITPRVA